MPWDKFCQSAQTCCVGLAAFIALFAEFAQAQVYGGRAPDGTVVLSNFRGAETPAVVIPLGGGGLPRDSAAPGHDAVALPMDLRAQMYSSIVSDVAQEVDVSAHLLHAVISVESSYLANAESPKGAQGLMQLMPATAQRFGVADPFNPRDNVRGGALYLKWLLQRFGGDLKLAIAGYNAGEDAVIRAGYRVPPFVETQRYVPRVMARLQRPATT
jgi:soluble lytic murein transglycosylase-like protein